MIAKDDKTGQIVRPKSIDNISNKLDHLWLIMPQCNEVFKGISQLQYETRKRLKFFISLA